MIQIRGVILDVDGTLVDSNDAQSSWGFCTPPSPV